MLDYRYNLDTKAVVFGLFNNDKNYDVSSSYILSDKPNFTNLTSRKRTDTKTHCIKFAYLVNTTTDMRTNLFLDKNLKKLEQMKLLEDNWNGYGAKIIDNELIEKCKNVIKNLTFQPEIFPTGRESIQLEYELENGQYLEFEVSNNSIDVLEIDINGEEKEYKTDFKHINRIVREFYE